MRRRGGGLIDEYPFLRFSQGIGAFDITTVLIAVHDTIVACCSGKNCIPV